MNNVRAFIIASSMLLTIWLAASYATQLEQVQQSPTAQKPAHVTENTVSTTATTHEQKRTTVSKVR